MNKVFRKVIVFLLITDRIIDGICLAISQSPDLFDRKSIFSLLPSHDEEYIPPIPVHFRNSYGFGRNIPSHRPRLSRSQNNQPELIDGPWIPLQNTQGTHLREVYLRPRVRSTHENPVSFDIPLRKSIQVSHTIPHPPAIQTTGYIRDYKVSKSSQPKFIGSSLNKETDSEVDSSRSAVNRTFTNENWTPKRIVHTVVDIRPKSAENYSPQNFNSNTDEHLKYIGIKLNDSDWSQSKHKEMNVPESFNDESDFSKYINEKLENYDVFFSQPVNEQLLNDFSNGNNQDNFSGIEHFGKNDNLNESFNKNADPPTYRNFLDFENLGIEYAEKNESDTTGTSNLKKTENTNKDKDDIKTISLLVGGKSVGHIPNQRLNKSISTENNTKRNDQNSMNSKSSEQDHLDNTEIPNITSKKVTQPDSNSQAINKKDSDVVASTQNSNVMKLNSKVKNNQNDMSQTKSISKTDQNKNQLQNQNSFNLEGKKVPDTIEGKIKESDWRQVVQVMPFSKTPFYGQNKGRDDDSLKEIKPDNVYFPPIFPETPWIGRNKKNSLPEGGGKQQDDVVQENIVFLNSSEIMSLASPSPDKEKLIELNPDHTKSTNHVIEETSSANKKRQNEFKKSGIFKDFSIFDENLPTPPSLITVNPDETITVKNNRVNVDFKRNYGDENGTNNYILERKPSLLPDVPRSTRPRKPNIRLSSGILAGILIAALIFLGFLTGTIVFAVHQFKYSSTRSKKKERQKNRNKVYKPQYIDEAFAGNTYIHNSIFLPNPHNLEDRDSPELDTSFSVDSEETIPVPDHSSTSRNSRHKLSEHTHIKTAQK